MTVGSSGDPLTHYLHHLCRAIGSAWTAAPGARNEKTVAGDEHTRAHHESRVDQVPHGDVLVVVRPEIAHRRHAGLKRSPRSVLRQVHDTCAPSRLADAA